MEHSTLIFSDNAAQRFRDYIDPQPYYGKGKELNQFGPKEDALKFGNYIQLPQTKHVYVGVDLDYRGAATSWEDEGLPLPTIIFTSSNGHANIFWELKNPVIRRCQLNQFTARQHPLDYYRAVCRGYTDLLGGDHGYTHSTIKNPFVINNWVQWYDTRYTLEELADYVGPLPAPKGYERAGNDKCFSGRNEELFNVVRKWAYKAVFEYGPDEFELKLKEFCRHYNETSIPANWPERGPLPASETQSVARGIVVWVLREKNNNGFKQRAKNIGVMGLPQISADLSDDERDLAVSCSQARGAAYTHAQQKHKTANKIIDAIKSILAEKLTVTRSEVSKRSGVGRRTLNNYKEIFKAAEQFTDQA